MGYLGTPSGYTTTFSDLSVVGTSDLGIVQATGAVAFDSTLAVTGVTTLSAALNSASAISGGTIAGTTGTFSGAIGTDSAISGAAIKGTSLEATTSVVTIAHTTPLSIVTAADDNDMTVGQLRLVFRASGLSLIWSSGTSEYELAESTVSAAQPTS